MCGERTGHSSHSPAQDRLGWASCDYPDDLEHMWKTWASITRSLSSCIRARFADVFPEENKHFQNVVFTDAVPNDKAASLLVMREKMLSRADPSAAVFIGGMDGVETEHELFRRFHPAAKPSAVDTRLAAINLDTISPREALDILYELKSLLKE